MDKFDKFLADVDKKTKSGDLKWKIAAFCRYEDYVFNARFVYQAYETPYVIGDAEYTIILVQRKDPITDDYDETFDKYHVELLLLLSKKLIFTLTEGHVDRKALLKLASRVEDSHEDAAHFFENFE